MQPSNKMIDAVLDFLGEHKEIIGAGVSAVAAYILDRKLERIKEWLHRRKKVKEMSQDERQEFFEMINENSELVAEAVAENPKLYKRIQKRAEKKLA